MCVAHCCLALALALAGPALRSGLEPGPAARAKGIMLRRCAALVGVAFVGLAAGHEHRHEHHHNHKHDKGLNCWEEDIFAFCMANVDDDMAADKRKYKFVRSKWRCFPLLEDYRSCQLSVDDEVQMMMSSPGAVGQWPMELQSAAALAALAESNFLAPAPTSFSKNIRSCGQAPSATRAPNASNAGG